MLSLGFLLDPSTQVAAGSSLSRHTWWKDRNWDYCEISVFGFVCFFTWAEQKYTQIFKVPVWTLKAWEPWTPLRKASPSVCKPQVPHLWTWVVLNTVEGLCLMNNCEIFFLNNPIKVQRLNSLVMSSNPSQNSLIPELETTWSLQLRRSPWWSANSWLKESAFHRVAFRRLWIPDTNTGYAKHIHDANYNFEMSRQLWHFNYEYKWHVPGPVSSIL